LKTTKVSKLKALFNLINFI